MNGYSGEHLLISIISKPPVLVQNVYSGDMKAKALQLWADKLEGLVSNYFEEYTATPMPSGEKPEGMNVN